MTSSNTAVIISVSERFVMINVLRLLQFANHTSSSFFRVSLFLRLNLLNKYDEKGYVKFYWYMRIYVNIFILIIAEEMSVIITWDMI